MDDLSEEEIHKLSKILGTQQWIDKYRPKKTNELYLHKKKKDDLIKWFTNADKALKEGIQTNSCVCVCDIFDIFLIYFFVSF